jgi:hypothetical protein
MVEEDLRNVISPHQKNWDKRLPNFLSAYRASTHEIMSTTPTSMVFMTELHPPCDLLFRAAPCKEQSVTDCGRSCGLAA